MKKFIDTGQSHVLRNTNGSGLGGIPIGAHGKGHLGSVSPTRTVAGRTSTYTPLNASRAAPAALALDLS